MDEQRYMCRNCRRTFTAKTKSFISKSHYPEKWLLYLECFKKNYSVRKSAKIVGISIPTSFAWRHKLLSSLKPEKHNKFIGYIELSSFIICHSEKGNKCLSVPSRKRGNFAYIGITRYKKEEVVIAEDRLGNKVLYFKSSVNESTRYLRETFYPLIDESNIIIGFERTVPKCTFNPKKIKYVLRSYNFNIPSCKDRIFVRAHLTTHLLRKWLNIFKGIASKNMPKYLRWFNLTDDLTNIIAELI